MRSNRKLEKRQRILEAAKALFLESGYKNTSTDKIAAKAKVSKAAIYSEFLSKENLFLSCAQDIFRDMFSHVWGAIKTERDNKQRLMMRTTAFYEKFEGWLSMMNLVKGLSGSPESMFHEAFKGILDKMTAPLVAELVVPQSFKIVNEELDRQLLAFVVLGATEAIFAEQIKAGAVLDEKIVRDAMDILL